MLVKKFDQTHQTLRIIVNVEKQNGTTECRSKIKYVVLVEWEIFFDIAVMY